MRIAATIFVVFLGVLLTLPGLCTLGFMIVLLPQSGTKLVTDPFSTPIVLMWLIGLGIGALGVWMIVAAVKGYRSQERSESR